MRALALMMVVTATLACSAGDKDGDTDDTDAASDTVDTQDDSGNDDSGDDDTADDSDDDTADDTDTDTTDTSESGTPTPSCYGPQACEYLAAGLLGGCASNGCDPGTCQGKFNDQPFYCDGLDENGCKNTSPASGWCTWDTDRGQCMNNDRCHNTYTDASSCNAATPGGNSCIWDNTTSRCHGTSDIADLCEDLSNPDATTCRRFGCIWGTNPPS